MNRGVRGARLFLFTRLSAASRTLLTGLLAGCAASGGGAPEMMPPPVPVQAAEDLPRIPAVDGPLQLTVVYPLEGAVVAASDSNFIFGATGSGRATLTINGTPVPVQPNGAYLAFLPVPADSTYRLEATKDGETARLERRILPVLPPSIPADSPAILRESIQPRGPIALPAGEPIEVSFLGRAGGLASLVLPDGRRVPLVEEPILERGTDQAADFRADAPAGRAVHAVSRYAGVTTAMEAWIAADSAVSEPRLMGGYSSILGISFGFDAIEDSTVQRMAAERGLPVPTKEELERMRELSRRMQSAMDTLGQMSAAYYRLARTWAQVELVHGTDTTRVPIDANVVTLDDTRSRVGVATPPPGAPSDWTARGKAGMSGPYHWFWPPGTRLELNGERGGQFRVRLTDELWAWVNADDITLLPEGTPLPRGTVPGVRFTAYADRIDLRIPLPARMPFRVDAAEDALDVTVYGATSEVNFLQYGSLDPLLARAAWSQKANDEFVVHVELTQPVWGYRTAFDETGALVVSIRRPPRIDGGHPLRGLLIAVDAGHPPGGSTGPTGLTEAAANLAVAEQLRAMLERAGARVLMTRVDPAPVDLGSRPRLAAELDAHVLLSLHNNALPDGVNPFVNHGTSTYYYQPFSLDLARAVQYELLRALGLRDLGIGRADLALARPTWMPSVLSETMFMMVPAHEAALRDPDVQRRIARAHLRALENFLRGRAQD